MKPLPEELRPSEILLWTLVSWLPRWLIEACLVRAWAEFEPTYDWERSETASMWRVYEEWVKNASSFRSLNS